MHISVGDLLRAEVAAGTPAGKRAQDFMDAGSLVPNEVRSSVMLNTVVEAGIDPQLDTHIKVRSEVLWSDVHILQRPASTPNRNPIWWPKVL